MRDLPGSFFTIQSVLVLCHGITHRGLRRYGTNGGHQYHRAKSRARRTTWPGYGGLRDHVHGRAADRIANRRWCRQTYRRTKYAYDLRDACADREPGFLVPRGFAFTFADHASFADLNSVVSGWRPLSK